MPSPESFFQSLYKEHSGNFKVRYLGCTLWMFTLWGSPNNSHPNPRLLCETRVFKT